MRFVFLLALLLAPIPVWACDGAPASEPFDPYAGLAYDDAKHQAWYRRFWTGGCEGLGFFDFCVADEGGWPLLIDRTLARASDKAKGPLKATMRNLGRRIGHEWARANDVRSIDTDDLQRWNDDLEVAENPVAAVSVICEEAKMKLSERAGR